MLKRVPPASGLGQWALRPVATILALLSLLAAGAGFAASPFDWEGNRPIPTPEEAARAARMAGLTRSISRRALPAQVTGDPGPAGTWSLIGPPSGMQRFEPSVVFDPVRQRLVSFAGSDTALNSDTWIFALSNGNWSKLTTAGSPPPARRLHGAVYDSNADRMIVFGGYNDDSLLSDVWQLSFSGGTPTWSQIVVSAGPTARAAVVPAFDAANNRAIFYGGYDGAAYPTGFSTDAWALSLGASPSWSIISATGTPPPGRIGMVGGFDSASSALYLFGGDGSDDGSSDLWKLTVSGSPAWSKVNASGDPGEREFASGGFDAVSGRFVIYGGTHVIYSSGGASWTPITLSDVWVVVPGSGSPVWQDVTPDPTILPRWGAGSVVSPAGDLYVVAGVSDHYQLLSDVWKLNVASPTAWQTWETLFPPRLQEVMVMDTNRHRLVAFGGTDGAYRNDTYVHPLDFGKGWAPLTVSGTPPSPRRLHTGIYDPVGDRLIVFGGYDDSFHNDTWQLTFSTPTPTWSPLVTAGTPPSPRAGHVAIYDPIGRQMIVSQGYDGHTLPSYRVNDSFALSLDGTPTWTPIAAATAPVGRSSASAVYDDAAHAMVVFGGTDPDFLNETWSLSLDGSPAWTQLSTAITPEAREEQSAVYDVSRDRMVIFGGYDTPTPYSHNYNDTWSLGFSGTPAWGLLSPTGDLPSARWGMKSVYDPGSDGMWMYGGWDVSYSQQLWFLQWSQPTVPAAIATTLAQGQSDHASLQWQLPAKPRTSALIQRSTDGVHWSRVGMRLPGGLSLPFTDRSVVPGSQYAYRALLNVSGSSMVSSPAWVTIPGTTGVVPTGQVAFGLSAERVSGGGVVGVMCSLPSPAVGRVQLLDVAGRVRDSHDLSGLPAGQYRIELGSGLSSGMYFVRLTHGAQVASLKSVVLH